MDTEKKTQGSRMVLRRIVLGLGANIFAQATTIVIQLVSIPLLLNAWGVDLYGEWLVLSAVPNYLAITNMSFGNVACNDVTMAMAKNDRKTALISFQSTFVLLLLISCVCLLFSIPMILYMPWLDLFNIHVLSYNEVCVLLGIFTLHIVLSMQSPLIDAAYRSHGHYPLFTVLNNVVRLAEFLALAIVATCGYGPIISALAYVLVRLVLMFGMVLGMRLKAPYVQYGFRYVQKPAIINMLKPAFGFMGQPLGRLLNTEGVLLLISNQLGNEMVVVFTTLRRLSRIAFQGLNQLRNAFWPEFSTALSAGQISLALKLHRRMYKLGVVGSVVVIPLLYFFGEFLIEKWLGKSICFDNVLYAQLLIALLFSTLWYTSSTVELAINTHIRQSVWYLVVNILMLLTAYITIPVLGVFSVSLLLIVVEMAMVIVVVPAVVRLLGDSMPGFFGYLFSFRI